MTKTTNEVTAKTYIVRSSKTPVNPVRYVNRWGGVTSLESEAAHYEFLPDAEFAAEILRHFYRNQNPVYGDPIVEIVETSAEATR